MKRRHLTLLLILLVTLTAVQAQISTVFSFGQQDPDRGGLLGNGITDILYKNNTLFVGTGFGLSITDDDGITWQNFTPGDYGGKGGVSALDVGSDGTIWIATAFDSLVEEDQSLSVGGGIFYLEPGSQEWQKVPQPIDAQSDTTDGMKPTTTPVQNVTFDLAVRGSDEIWIASFGGGIRRSLDRGANWEVITTDGQPFSSLDFLNHRGFSAIVDTSDNIWVGTVGGISKSVDGGTTWERFTPTSQGSAISGNWVIGLFHNPYDNSIWATTLRAVEQEEFNGISVTRNGGTSWEVYLAEELSDGTFPRYVAFYDSATYVATENGVFKSIDGGDNWFKLPPIRDAFSGEALVTSTFYSVATSPFDDRQHRLWVGSLDGLANTVNSGFDWTIFRAFVSTRDERTDPSVYAYPNPYSPLHSDRPCRFQFDVTSGGEVSIEIYNFALERVVTLTSTINQPGPGSYDRSVLWDGIDSNGRLVDNGVYHFRANIGGDVTWGKLVIIN